MHRRFAALAASAFLVNLNVGVVDRACDSRHDRATVAHEHSGHEHHGTTPSQHEAPRKCCDALSTCGVTLSIGGEVLLPLAASDHIVGVWSRVRSPDSVPRAPEPPPPKA